MLRNFYNIRSSLHADATGSEAFTNGADVCCDTYGLKFLSIQFQLQSEVGSFVVSEDLATENFAKNVAINNKKATLNFFSAHFVIMFDTSTK